MKSFSLLSLFLMMGWLLSAQPDTTIMKSGTYSALKFRNIGPALTSGRIADIAIHPINQNIMYVAVGSGGVWKTTNAGTTWSPIFDGQTSYSIGCVTIDPSNHNIIWVGTGENVGGRHVGFGDGVYRSLDAGATWQNMGLKESEHISKIVVHPEDSDVILVAAQGPLWSKGGERGLYKSTDGGSTWTKTLGDDEWTGVTDVVMDPTDPDVLYAATWQRHRTVAAYMGGGPESGIHKSTDGGDTWTKSSAGLPMSNLGKTGLAISPFDHNVVYAAIETDRKTGGLYMSSDQGASWTRQSDMTSGGTGPHYYQELYADPHQEGRLYLMNNYVLISDDHGKTYRQMNEDKKHVDTHAIAWRSSDPDYVIMGTDGGLYESFDKTKTWRYISNLPVTQYYKLAVDDAEPFYNIYGGTQDNGSHGGPSRTMRSSGIHNRDWRIVLGADGHQSATEPGNPNITYGEFQEGWLWRIDHKTKESVFIQPQPAEGEPYERFNWDAPILVSPHDPARLYFASQRVWRSDNRGDEWTPISSDLTKNEVRLSLPIMGKQQSWDNPWDVDAMSNYNTITSLAESPIQEGLLYAGTDDGIIQVSEDGGENWRKIELKNVRGVPATAFVNDIRADLHDAHTVYAALDNHKYGDFQPYFIKSTDSGKTWKSATGDLPERLLVWRMVQDHIDPDLMFLATEFGIYFTNDGGEKWIQLKGGLPTISFRDITIQRREGDLVAASFGRGFYVLDDYTALRSIDADALSAAEATVFEPRDGYWYTEEDEIYGQGNNEYAAENPPYGVTFTYFLRDKYESAKSKRKEKEKELTKSKSNIPFPGWEELDTEKNEEEVTLMFEITDAAGKAIKNFDAPASKGMNRATWDLSLASKSPLTMEAPRGSGNWFGGGGFKATPGSYTATLYKLQNGIKTQLGEPVSFDVNRMIEPTLRGASYDEIAAFRGQYEDYQQLLTETNRKVTLANRRLDVIKKAVARADEIPSDLVQRMYDAKRDMIALDIALNGNQSKKEVGEKQNPLPTDGEIYGWVGLSGTYGPTANHKKGLNRASSQLQEIQPVVEAAIAKVKALQDDLSAIGAPIIIE